MQLAQRLQATHEALCAWLDKVEVELLSYETQVLKGEAASQAHARQKVRSDPCSVRWLVISRERPGHSGQSDVYHVSPLMRSRTPLRARTQQKLAADQLCELLGAQTREQRLVICPLNLMVGVYLIMHRSRKERAVITVSETHIIWSR